MFSLAFSKFCIKNTRNVRKSPSSLLPTSLNRPYSIQRGSFLNIKSCQTQLLQSPKLFKVDFQQRQLRTMIEDMEDNSVDQPEALYPSPTLVIGENYFPRNEEIGLRMRDKIRLVSEEFIKVGEKFTRSKSVEMDPNYDPAMSDEDFIKIYKPTRLVSRITEFDRGLRIAKESKLDLIAVGKDSQSSNLLVCKVVNYGEFMKDLRDKERRKKKVRVQKIKEVVIGVNIADHDMMTKTNKIKSILEEGDQARVIILFPKGQVSDLRLANGILDLILVHIGSAGKRDASALKITPKEKGDFVTCFFYPKVTTKKESDKKETFFEEKVRDKKQKKSKERKKEEEEEDERVSLMDLDDMDDMEDIPEPMKPLQVAKPQPKIIEKAEFKFEDWQFKEPTPEKQKLGKSKYLQRKQNTLHDDNDDDDFLTEEQRALLRTIDSEAKKRK